MSGEERQLLSGNEAVALAAKDAGVALGVGYPGTPSTEILENFAKLGGNAQWSPNEKVALEVGIGVAYARSRTLVTMKHVGVNVAADPLFTVAYTGVDGGLVIISADDPGMHSSQNEQDNRRYAEAAAIPMLEPSDSQEAYDFTLAAFALSEEWRMPVILRMTTRVCHSNTIVRQNPAPPMAPHYEKDVQGRVMIPGYARPAHKQLRAKLRELQAAVEQSPLTAEFEGSPELGIITSGISFVHSREAAPEASVLKLGVSYPLPIERMKAFAAKVSRCVVVEEGDPYLYTAMRAAGAAVEEKPEMYRFGELNVERVRRILNHDETEEPATPPGKPPKLCASCPHRTAFAILSRNNCIVAGDIGCYTLGVMPPFQAMDTCVCMGASIGVGLGLRHALPEDEAKRVVSVIGDSTFVHSGLTGIAEMAYNPPATGHLVLLLDNGTTAMTGTQEHPGTGRKLDHSPTSKLDFEKAIKGLGVARVTTTDPMADPEAFEALIKRELASGELSVIIARRPCILMENRKDRAETAAPAPAGAESGNGQ